jgi:Holliday junction resolvasome RuvABC endonuclease subunit
MRRTNNMPEFKNPPPIPNEKPREFIILCNDPSVRAWGYSVLNGGGRILTTGCIKTESGGKKMRIRKGDDNTRRVQEINLKLLEVIRKWNVNYLVSELPHGSQSAAAAATIGMCIGIMQSKSDDLGIGLEWYSEGDSKKAALGKQKAEKKEMIRRMSQLYPQGWLSGVQYIDEAVADSLAIHHVACKESSTLKLFNSK